MTSVECVASCTSAQSSETTSNRIDITDFRGGKFARRQINYEPEDTFRTVYERAHLDSAIDMNTDTVAYTIGQNQQILTADDLDCKLAEKGCSGSVKIVIKNSQTLNREEALTTSPSSSQEKVQQEITEFDSEEDEVIMNDNNNIGDDDVFDKIDDVQIRSSFLDEISTKASERKQNSTFSVDEEREKKNQLGKVVDSLDKKQVCCNEDKQIVASYDSRSATGFAGLNNQGATCYMNSLIQSLYMNPEFRKLVYDWSFENHFQPLLKRRRAKNPDMTEEQEKQFREEKEKNSIPLQLQSLFAQMQLTQSRSVSTKKLTKSFAWDATDAFTQHDVTELRQVLFEALEKALAGTDQATMIKDLFEGEVLEYVRCLGCNHENVKSVPLYEVLLDIKVFGETEAVKSIEEALSKFITPEVLDEDNLYNCDACGNKCRAVKGTRLKRIPYFLMMQMKRFDFDFATMNRVKLCDRVSFPHTLNMADYVEGGKIDRELMAKATGKKLEELIRSSDKVETQEKQMEQNEEEETKEQEEKPEQTDDAMIDAEPADSTAAHVPAEVDSAGEAKEKDDSVDIKDGSKNDLIYDLFAILIHSGGANGGHYYAYIKDYRSGKWFEFNDSSVTSISEADIQSVFGKDSKQTSYGGYGGYYSNNSYGTTAYMLMYRKVDPKKNILPPTDDDVPKSLREYIEKENAAEIERKRRERLERETLHLTVLYNEQKKEFSKHESFSVADLKADIIKEYQIDAKPEDVRLFLYDSYFKKNTLLVETDLLKECGFSYWNKEVLVESKKPDEEWSESKPNEIKLHIYYEDVPESTDGESAPVDAVNMKVASFDLAIDENAVVEDLRKMISDKLGIDVANLRLIKKATNSFDLCETLKYDKDTLEFARIDDGDDLFAEKCDNPTDSANRENSRCYRFLEESKNKVTYHIYVSGEKSFDIEFDQRHSLTELRDLISEKTGLSVDNIVLKRGNEYYTTEMKDLDLSTKDNYLSHNGNVYVEKGVMGSHEVRLFLWRPEKNKADFLFRLVVVESELISAFIERAVQQYTEFIKDKEDYPRAENPSCYGLREYSYDNEFPGNYYNPQLTVKSSVSYFSNDKMFMLDVLKEPIDFPEPSDAVRLFCYEWHPSTLTVSQVAKEIVVRKNAPINDIRRSLVSIHEPIVKEEKTEEVAIEGKKDEQPIPEATEMKDQPASETTEKEEKPTSELADDKEQITCEYRAEDVCIIILDNYGRIRPPTVQAMVKSVDQAPSWEKSETLLLSDLRQLYIRSGYSIAFWNKTEPKKELPVEEEQTAVNNNTSTTRYSSGYSYSSSSTYTSSYWQRKERGIKIHVDEDSDDEDSDDGKTEATKKTETEAPPAATAAADTAASTQP